MKSYSSFLLILFLALASSWWVHAESEPEVPEALKGENLPKGQYKKLNRDRVTVIAQGDPKDALAYAAKYLEKHPDDLECRYLQVLAHSKLGDGEKALELAKEAVAKGLPGSRIASGPRNLIETLVATPGYKEFAAEHVPSLLHGPTVGAVTDDGAQFWVRTAEEVDVEISVQSVIVGAKEAPKTGTVKTSADVDFTGIIKVEGLKPGTQYNYLVKIDGKDVEEGGSFTTFPEHGKPAEFEIGFGGGAGYTPWKEHMWNTVRKEKPAAFFLLGDNVYIDTPECQETQRYCYYRRQSRPEFRAFAANTPVFAIWDDHDFGDNDCTSHLDPDKPAWKRGVLEVFRENWVNPSYGGGDDGAPGIWFKTAIGDVDFFFLDCRYYRQNPKEVTENPSMIGPDQKKWLLEEVKQSKATFKVLCSSVPWAPGAGRDQSRAFRFPHRPPG